MMLHWNLLNFLANLATIILVSIWIILQIKQHKWRVFQFFRRETIESLERKMFSFDDAILPKFITDEKGVTLDINTAAQLLFGYQESEIVGKNISCIFPKESLGKYNKMMEDSEKKDAERESSRYDLVKKGGMRVPTEVIIRKRIFDKMFVYLFVIRDRTAEEVTARKYEQYIDILKLKAEILSRGEKIANMGSWLWDLKMKENDKAITPSENYRRIVGLQDGPRTYSIENIKPRVWPGDTKIVDAALDRAINHGEDYDITYKMIRATDFQVIHLRSQAHVFKDADGVVIALSGVATLLKTENLSDASRAEEEKK